MHFLSLFVSVLLLSLSEKTQTNVTEAFNSISNYFEDLQTADDIYFEEMVDHSYPREVQLNKNDIDALYLALRCLCYLAMYSASFPTNNF